MCGIVGFAGNIRHNHEKAFENLLVIDSVRGKHSTGIAVVNENTKEVTVAKQACNALDFIDTKKYSEATRGFASVLIGHNRYATIGKVNNVNAHPFDFPNVVGVHNGTLTERYNLFEQSFYDTDSESLYSHINEYGIDDAIAKTRGAWALVWYDKQAETVNFLRNNDRTLYITVLDDAQHTIAWASEAWMLHGALGRNGIKYHDVTLIPINTLLTFKVTKTGVEKPRTREIKERPPLVVTNHSLPQSGGGRWKQGNVNAFDRPPKKHPLAGDKKVLLELKLMSHKPKGVGYFICYEPLTKNNMIKLYVTKDLENLLQPGDLITADINHHTSDDGYVTVNPNTVEQCAPSEGKDEDENGKKLGEEVVFKDHKGKYISHALWLKEYGTCSWCTANINPAIDDYSLSSNGESFCPTCKGLDDVADYIKMAS